MVKQYFFSIYLRWNEISGSLELHCPVWSKLSCVATEHLKCGWSKLRCAESIKETLDFKDLVKKKKKSLKCIINAFSLLNVKTILCI